MSKNFVERKYRVKELIEGRNFPTNQWIINEATRKEERKERKKREVGMNWHSRNNMFWTNKEMRQIRRKWTNKKEMDSERKNYDPPTKKTSKS